MAPQVPVVQLNNGYSMPVIGLGTANDYHEKIRQAIDDALAAGYRHFDGAMFYSNEADIGSALHDQIQTGTVQRKDLFIVSKLWCTFMSPELVEPTLRKTLQDLQLEYLDLYLIHWPMAYQENSGLLPLDSEGRVLIKEVDFVDTWKAMEECVKKGLVRSLGVSNFNSQQLKRLLDNCTMKPVTNQVECHPYLNQKNLIDFCRQYDIIITAYGPLGRPGLNLSDDPIPLDDPTLKNLAAKYSKSVAQIILRYLTQKGIPVIPKSSNNSRILENIASLEFILSSPDVAIIDGLDRNLRLLKESRASHHPEYPFHLPF